MIRSFQDQLGQAVTIAYPPHRIVSLVPSQTELLFNLELCNEVVGITKFCIHPPEWRDSKTIIGGTKNFAFDSIRALQPDLIIGNKEENYREGIEKLRDHYPVWMSDISSLPDAIRMIKSLGEITNRHSEANVIAKDVEDAFSDFKTLVPSSISVLYLIWRKPWMGAGSGTFIHDMLNRIGFTNCLQHQTRYPELSTDQIRALRPDFIFLSSEPFPFGDKHSEEIQVISPSSRVLLVNGEMFSWYGSRLRKAVDYFKSLSSELVI